MITTGSRTRDGSRVRVGAGRGAGRDHRTRAPVTLSPGLLTRFGSASSADASSRPPSPSCDFPLSDFLLHTLHLCLFHLSV